ncbi:MAG: agmatinase [Bacteroidota bacterium]
MKPIALTGIAYDEKSSFLRGAASAPPLIRQCLHSGSSGYYTESGQSIQQSLIEDRGDFKINDYWDIERIASEILEDGRRLLTLGGDHSISYPLIKAYRQYYDSFAILHIDAHTDLYHEFDGDAHSHACPFARIMESALATRLVQIGIRNINPHQKSQIEKFNVEVIQMKDFSIHQLPQFKRPIYLSLDLDALDPAFAPGVSHHEPGGLTTREVLRIIQQIEVPIIGADIVEYNPIRDHQGITAALAATFVKEILGKMITPSTK